MWKFDITTKFFALFLGAVSSATAGIGVVSGDDLVVALSFACLGGSGGALVFSRPDIPQNRNRYIVTILSGVLAGFLGGGAAYGWTGNFWLSVSMCVFCSLLGPSFVADPIGTVERIKEVWPDIHIGKRKDD